MVSNRLFLREYHKGLILAILALLIGINVIALGTDCTREHHGDLIIKGDEVFTISNQTFCQYGNIVVRDNAQLVVRNATIEMLNKEEDTYIHILDSARVVFESLRLSLAINTHLQISAYDRTLLYIEGMNVPAHGLVVEADDDSKVVVRLSKISEFHVRGHANVLISGCLVSRAINLGFSENPAIKIRDLRPGYLASWVFPLDTPCPWDLEVRNTKAPAWWIQVSGDVRLHLRDSEIDALSLDSGYCYVVVSSSHVSNTNFRDIMGEIRFEDVQIDHSFKVQNTLCLTVSGSVNFGSGKLIEDWRNSTILRTYNVSVEDQNGFPAARALLDLESPSGKHLSVTTDEEGLASFSISFDDSNYSENWILTATLGDQSVVCPVSFMSSSPVNVHLSAKGKAATDSK